MVEASPPRRLPDVRAQRRPMPSRRQATSTARSGHDHPPARTRHASADGVGRQRAKLIGRTVHNAQDETIGEIKSVYIGPDGKVDSLIVGRWAASSGLGEARGPPRRGPNLRVK